MRMIFSLDIFEIVIWINKKSLVMSITNWSDSDHTEYISYAKIRIEVSDGCRVYLESDIKSESCVAYLEK